VVTAVGVLMVSATSQIQQYNTASIFVRRVLPDPTALEWSWPTGCLPTAPKCSCRYQEGSPTPRWRSNATEVRPLARGRRPSTTSATLASHPGFVVTTPFSTTGRFEHSPSAPRPTEARARWCRTSWRRCSGPRRVQPSDPRVAHVGLLVWRWWSPVRYPSRRGAMAAAVGLSWWPWRHGLRHALGGMGVRAAAGPTASRRGSRCLAARGGGGGVDTLPRRLSGARAAALRQILRLVVEMGRVAILQSPEQPCTSLLRSRGQLRSARRDPASGPPGTS